MASRELSLRAVDIGHLREDLPPFSSCDCVLALVQARLAFDLLRNQVATTNPSARKFYHTIVEMLHVCTPNLLC